MLALQRPAGVPDGLPPDELERWSNELVAFLTSEKVPAGFRAWSRRQADALDAYMASAEDFEADAGDGDAEEERAPVAAARKQTSPRAAKAASSRAAPARDPGMLVVRVPEQIGKLGIGVIVGVLALGAIFGVRALTSGSGGSALPPASGAAAFPQARADELTAQLAQDPSNKDALFEIGEINFQADRNEEAISWFTKLVELDPKNTHAMTDVGTANYNLGRPGEAKTWWQKVLAVDPGDVQAHYNMGFVFANAEPRDLAGAVNEWETVVRLDPTSQLGQTAKVHVEGLKSQLVGTAAPTAAP